MTTETQPQTSRILIGYMHPSDFTEVRDGGWVNTTLSREPVPFSVPVYADEPIAILRAQADALASPPPAEPGELPRLLEPQPIPGFYEIEARKACVFTADQMHAYARLALAQSPLPKERVERVMALVSHCTAIHRLHVLGHTTDTECSNAFAAVRAILEGRQP